MWLESFATVVGFTVFKNRLVIPIAVEQQMEVLNETSTVHFVFPPNTCKALTLPYSIGS